MFHEIGSISGCQDAVSAVSPKKAEFHTVLHESQHDPVIEDVFYSGAHVHRTS